MQYSIESLNKTGIYSILNLINGKQYIGSTTVSFIKRWKSHLTRLRTNKHHSPNLQNAFNKYSEKSFEFIIIEFCSIKECLNREQYYIDTLKVYDREFGYNVCRFAGNTLGRKHSEESKTKLRISGLGNKSALGYKHSDTAKAKMSLSRLGNKHTLGYKHSDATKAKLALANKGRKHNCITHIFINPNNEAVIINDLKQLCIDNNLNYKCMLHVKAGRHKQHKGWTYKHPTSN